MVVAVMLQRKTVQKLHIVINRRTVVDNGDGTYTCSLARTAGVAAATKEAEAWQLEVLLNSEHMLGAPCPNCDANW